MYILNSGNLHLLHEGPARVAAKYVSNILSKSPHSITYLAPYVCKSSSAKSYEGAVTVWP